MHVVNAIRHTTIALMGTLFVNELRFDNRFFLLNEHTTTIIYATTVMTRTRPKLK